MIYLNFVLNTKPFTIPYNNLFLTIQTKT